MKKPVKIGVDASTRDVLRGLKRGGDTFDDVVRRLIEKRHGLGIWTRVPEAEEPLGEEEKG